MPIHRLSDARLVRRSQQGDRDAFVVFLQRYDHRLRGLVYALTARPKDAELSIAKRPATLALVVLALTVVLNLVFR